MPRLFDKFSSFALVRTNPKISGNVKVTVDSKGDIWLNTFDATKELSSSEFKKFKLNANGSYASDLRKFIGVLPPEIVFATKELNPEPDNISNSFKDQYDFFYNTGAENLVSKAYDEDYSYLAPLWLRDDLPEHFVIFRVDDPLELPYNKNVESGDLVNGKKYVVVGDTYVVKYGLTNYTNGQIFTAATDDQYVVIAGEGKVVDLDENKDIETSDIDLFETLVKKAQVIKTFDLTEKSSIGKYIRNILNTLPDSPLTVRFGEGLMTTWNGISYKDGVITSKGERLDSFWTKGKTQIEMERYVSDGFKKNSIICPFLLNLEFLFNDDTIPTYSIPRYFGFYVNKVKTAEFQLDGNALYDNRNVSGNTPAPKRPNKGFRQQEELFYQNNTDGVRMFYMNERQVDNDTPLFIPSSDTFTVNYKNRMYWIQDKNGVFYSFDQLSGNAYNVGNKDIVIRNKSINLGDFAGPGSVKVQDKGRRLSDKGRSYMVVRIGEELSPIDQFSLYWNLGVYSDVDGKYHKIIGNDLSKRPFTVPANGTVLTISSMDVTSQYEIGQQIQINYGVGQSVVKTLTAAPAYVLGDTLLTIDSPIDLTTTNGTTPIVLGWGPGSAMTSVDNGTIYFHPYGTNEQIAKAIAKALNSIEDKTFDAVQIDDAVVIRLRAGGSASNSFFMKASLWTATNVLFQEQPYTLGNKYYFEGGTDVAHIRLRFPFTASDKMKDGEVFVKTKRGLSKVAFVGRYVDEAVNEAGGSDLGDLAGFREYGALFIEDNLDEPILTTVGEFISYQLFYVPVGLFSFLSVKEMDGDFLSSTYNRSPRIESWRYFDIPKDTPDVLVSGRKYFVKSDKVSSITYLGKTHQTSLSAPFVSQIFVAGEVTDELGSVGNGLDTTFNFKLDFPTIKPTSVSITDTVETFIDNGNGYLTGNLGGFGSVDYQTGDVTVSFNTPVASLQQIKASYYNNSGLGFSELTGSPIVVAQIFHKSHVFPGEPMDPTKTYVLFGDPTEQIEQFDGTVPNPISMGNKSASFAGVVLDPNVYSYVNTVGYPLVVEMDRLEMDDDLGLFTGFWTMKNISDANAGAVDTGTINFSNREKFVHNDVDSEYEYLKENYAKELSVQSRIFPSTVKWVYKGGTDVRDNPYRLNVNPAFGPMNFSPSFVIKTPDPEGFTHEWPYLEQPPQQFPAGLLADNNYYFFYDKIDMTKVKDANPSSDDYFTEYFTFSPAANAPDQDRFSEFVYNAQQGFCETMFRGVKVNIKEVVQDTRTDAAKGIKPPFKKNSKRFEDYKFSVLLRPRKEDKSKIEAPVSFTIIENKTAKTVLFTIDVIVEDYRTIKLVEPSNVGTYAGSPIQLYPEALDVSIDYTLLYSLRSKRTEKVSNDTAGSFIRGLDAYDFGDVKLSFGFAPELPSGLVPGFIAVNARNNPDYDWDTRDEIKSFNKENVFYGSSIFGPAFFSYPLQINDTQILFGIPGNSYPQDSSPYWPVINPVTAPVPIYDPTAVSVLYTPSGASIPVPYGSSFFWENRPFTQLHAGFGYYEPIMQRLSFGRIVDKINEYSSYIKYKSYTWDEATNTTKETSNEFYIELVEHDKVPKVEAILPVIDEDRPQELKDEDVIGINYTTSNYYEELYRYPGTYEPKFNNVLFFEPQKTDEIAEAGVDLSFTQATFNPNVSGFGLVKNMGFLKVAVRDVLSLANNSKYKPRYPLIGETPIDYRDMFVFGSNWDPGFWRLYSTKKNYTPQAGTREMQEVKNFFGTKIMKTLRSIRLQDWTIEPQLASLDKVDVANYTGEIVFAVVDGKVQALMNLKKRLLRFLINDGAGAEFYENLMPQFGTGDPTTLDDDVTEYLNLNVVPTYETKLVDLYIKKYQENAGLPLIRTDLTDAQKLQNGYLLDKNFTVTKKSDFVYYFEYVLDNSFNVSLAPSVTIGKI